MSLLEQFSSHQPHAGSFLTELLVKSIQLEFCRLATLQWDGASSALDQAVLGPAAGMVQCRTCNALLVRAWALACAWVHMGRLHSLPLSLMRHLHEFVDTEVCICKAP